MKIESIVKGLAVIVLGVLFPAAILIQAYFGVSSLASAVADRNSEAEIQTTFGSIKKQHFTGNDYLLYSQMYAEGANKKMMINKQVMKVTVMMIGFAVTSVGMMFIVLGINDGGGTMSAPHFDLKTGSTGVLVFVVGAAMSAGAGLLKNDYGTVPVPSFYRERAASMTQQLEPAREQCRREFKNDNLFYQCFTKTYEQLAKEQSS